MARHTEFIGHIDVEPALNEHEVAWLAAWSKDRHWNREWGPYVLSDPFEERPDYVERTLSRRHHPAPGMPDYWCRWVPTAEGDALVWDGQTVFDAPDAWLAWLVRHLIGRSALARSMTRPPFTEFTFDHVLNGTVVGRRLDTRELFAVRVTNNRVSRQTLRPGDGVVRRTVSRTVSPARGGVRPPRPVVVDLASFRR